MAIEKQKLKHGPGCLQDSMEARRSVRTIYDPQYFVLFPIQLKADAHQTILNGAEGVNPGPPKP